MGVKSLTIKGDSQLLVNFSNKIYEPNDEHMEAYLAEVCKMEKQFWGLELQHVPRGTNQEADDIAKRASKQLPQELGVFEERLFKPSAVPPLSSTAQPREELPQPPAPGAPVCGPTSGARLLLRAGTSGGVLDHGAQELPNTRHVAGKGGGSGACGTAGHIILPQGWRALPKTTE